MQSSKRASGSSKPSRSPAPAGREAREEYARALQEKARRVVKRREPLLDFIPRVSPHFYAPEHLAPVARLFERIARGERVRACVSVPAQHGKTETILHALAWLLDRDPRETLAYVTYAQEQADSKSLLARQYARAAGVPLSEERANLSEWRTTRGGGCLFTGVGGPLTGQGVRALVVDDPYKNRLEAESALIRSRVLSWFTSVGLTRLPEHGSVVVIHTRWVESDLIGSLAAGEAGGDWEVVNLPFLSDEHGTADELGSVVLWPQRTLPDGKVVGWTLEGARARLRSVGPYDAASIYQGRPMPSAGRMFERGWWRWLDAAPAGPARRVRAWDLAGSRDGDWTVGVRMAHCPGAAQPWVVEDVVRMRGTPFEVRSTILATAQFDGRDVAITVPQDPGQAGLDQAQSYVRDLAGWTVRPRRPTGDKALRARPFASQVQAGNVALVRGPWTVPYVVELDGFPGGANDDQVDASSDAFNELEATVAADFAGWSSALSGAVPRGAVRGLFDAIDDGGFGRRE